MNRIRTFPRFARRPASLPRVAFVELFDGRLQGVVSAERPYVAFVQAHTGDHGCRTSDGRPCDDLHAENLCEHLEALLAGAEAEYGADRVRRYLGLRGADGARGLGALGGRVVQESVADVFSRFLDYVRYVQLPSRQRPRARLARLATG